MEILTDFSRIYRDTACAVLPSRDLKPLISQELGDLAPALHNFTS
jgi:hypothetical protein